MMRVRPEQLIELDQGFRASQRRTLLRRFAMDYPEQASRASHFIGVALMDADMAGFSETEHIYYLAQLQQRLEGEEPSGRWGELLIDVLFNLEATPEGRIAFVEQEIWPRAEAERQRRLDDRERDD